MIHIQILIKIDQYNVTHRTSHLKKKVFFISVKHFRITLSKTLTTRTQTTVVDGTLAVEKYVAL